MSMSSPSSNLKNKNLSLYNRNKNRKRWLMKKCLRLQRSVSKRIKNRSGGGQSTSTWSRARWWFWRGDSWWWNWAFGNSSIWSVCWRFSHRYGTNTRYVEIPESVNTSDYIVTGQNFDWIDEYREKYLADKKKSILGVGRRFWICSWCISWVP